MNEPSVPLSKLGAYSLWALTAALLLAAWGVYAFRLADLAIMLATSACVTGLGATTLTIRCYARHVANLVRIAGCLRDDEAGGPALRSIRE